jgi:1-acyl-sn-glycerol-3-phosphate acyltransferase
MADSCLMFFFLLVLASGVISTAWPLVVLLFALPAVFLAPQIGALANSLPRRWVLSGAAGFCFLPLALYGLSEDPGLVWLILWPIGAALYSSTCSALLPAAAEDAGIPLPRVNGWLEIGTALAIVGGLFLAGQWYLYPSSKILWILAGLNLVAMLGAFPTWFQGDVRRPETPGRGMIHFFHDARRILQKAEQRWLLLLLGFVRGLFAAAAGLILVRVLGGRGRISETALDQLTQLGTWLGGGFVLGALLASIQGHPRRSLGMIGYAAIALVIGLLFTFGSLSLPTGSWLFLGAMAGLIHIPLLAAYQGDLFPDARGNGMVLFNLVGWLAMTGLAFLMYLVLEHSEGDKIAFWLLVGLGGLVTLVSWWAFLRETLEQLTEIVVWPMYRLRAAGPGLDHFPLQGPLLVIANHSAWLDPLWLAKVLPRRLTGMLTSNFYDRPGLRWIFKDILKTIRVQASAFRREAPELMQAIKALDEGECVVLFPEGMMRRREDRPLKMFGQGVWHILRERPATPVLVCWIEGGWGSYFSYWGGPPTRDKKLDFRRRISIAVAKPQVLDDPLLTNHRALRLYLMEVCLETRRHLGLEPLERHKGAEEETEDQEAT